MYNPSWKERLRIAPWPYLQILGYFSSWIGLMWWLGPGVGILFIGALTGMMIVHNLHEHAATMVGLYYTQQETFKRDGEERMLRSAFDVMYRHPKGNWLCYRWALYMAARDLGRGKIFRKNLRNINGQLWKLAPTLRRR